MKIQDSTFLVLVTYRDTPHGPVIARELPYGHALKVAGSAYDSRVIDPGTDAILYKRGAL